MNLVSVFIFIFSHGLDRSFHHCCWWIIKEVAQWVIMGDTLATCLFAVTFTLEEVTQDLASHWHECWFLNRQQNQRCRSNAHSEIMPLVAFWRQQRDHFSLFGGKKIFPQIALMPQPLPCPGSMQLCGGWDSSSHLPTLSWYQRFTPWGLPENKAMRTKSECSCSCSLQQFKNYRFQEETSKHPHPLDNVSSAR